MLTLQYFLSKEMKCVLGSSKGLEMIVKDQFYFSSLSNCHFTNFYIPSFPNVNIQVNTKPIRSYTVDGDCIYT